MNLVTVDFETWPILQRPAYPPKPVGVAIKYHGEAPRYLRWGHIAGGNNCDEAYARAELEKVWNDPRVHLLFHNSKFDVAVATEGWGLPLPPWDRIHDTMFLAFLHDPHAPSLGLKPLADNLLGMPPEERDAVADWVMAFKDRLAKEFPQLTAAGLKLSRQRAGAWIFAAPGDVVEPYANGDVIRTEALFEYFMADIERRGMAAAYHRERRLMPILMENERVGMRVDTELLMADVERYGKAFEQVEAALRVALRASGLNFDSDQDVAAILIERGVVPEHNFTRTAPTKNNPNGQLSMSKTALLPEHFVGQTGQGVPGIQIAHALGYRNRLATCLNTFMRPWLRQALVNNGYITTNWNQTRGEFGTRTGRPSTNDHNFLNISKSFEGRDDQYEHPVFLGVPELPLCRVYILPDEGQVFCHRDFSGQELRIFGHFEQGALWEQYQQNPRLDVHAFVGDEMMRITHREIERTKIKAMNFQGMYGGGAPALSAALRISLAEAKQLKEFHNQALPGRKILVEEIKRVVGRGLPIRTIGGREYYPEAVGVGERSKDYKLINYLIQGSAADLTKEAIIVWDEMNTALPAEDRARFLVTVYDEINVSSPAHTVRKNMALLREAMELPRVSVPMLSDGKAGPAWGKLEKYDDGLE